MECWNYLSHRNKLHGFVQHSTSAMVDRLAKNCDEEEGQQEFCDATVVWVATRNSLATETYVVGWWKNATVHRNLRPHPKAKRIEREIIRNAHALDDEPSYCITCAEFDSFLVPEPERIFQIPRGKGWMGHRSLVWYADGDSDGHLEPHSRFKKAVGAYMVGILLLSATNFFSELDDNGHEEGRRKFMSHFSRERSHAAVRKAKNLFQSQHEGHLFCQACKVDFSIVYGDIGRSYIEAHHLRPLAGEGSRRTRPEDFVMLCSNCHRMVHRLISRLDRPVAAEEIQQLVVPGYINGLLSDV